jgi:hypothetical protein
MKIQKQLAIALVTFIVGFNTLVPISYKSSNPYLKSIINSINNNSFIEASGQYYGGTPFVTVAVEQYTPNHLPNITGTCSIGDAMNFTIKKGNTGVVSETFSKLCDVSNYYSS